MKPVAPKVADTGYPNDLYDPLSALWGGWMCRTGALRLGPWGVGVVTREEGRGPTEVDAGDPKARY